MTQQVYVYATDSYTETTIKDFLQKINQKIHWVIRSPSLRKMAKKDYIINAELPILTGRTGADLEKFMIDEIMEHSVILTECVAVMLEDDLDRRDSSMDQDEYLQVQQDRLSATLSEIKEQRTAKFICLYAAPEVETWLIEDWGNSFGDAALFDSQIAAELRKALNKIRDDCGGNFECYSHHFSEKFSDWLIDRIQQCAVSLDKTDIEKASYAKKRLGAKFLQAIEPQIIEQKCRIYFAKAYHAIHEI